jgi:hypothetical protein
LIVTWDSFSHDNYCGKEIKFQKMIRFCNFWMNFQHISRRHLTELKDIKKQIRVDNWGYSVSCGRIFPVINHQVLPPWIMSTGERFMRRLIFSKGTLFSMTTLCSNNFVKLIKRSHQFIAGNFEKNIRIYIEYPNIWPSFYIRIA